MHYIVYALMIVAALIGLFTDITRPMFVGLCALIGILSIYSLHRHSIAWQVRNNTHRFVPWDRVENQLLNEGFTVVDPTIFDQQHTIAFRRDGTTVLKFDLHKYGNQLFYDTESAPIP